MEDEDADGEAPEGMAAGTGSMNVTWADDADAVDPGSRAYLTYQREQAKLKGEFNDATKLEWSLSKLVEETETQIRKQEELRYDAFSKLKKETAALNAELRKVEEGRDKTLSQLKAEAAAQIKKAEESLSKLKKETETQIREEEEIRDTLSKMKVEAAAQIKKEEDLRDNTLSKLNNETAGLITLIKKEKELRDSTLSKLKEETATQLKKENEDRKERLSKLKEETAAQIKKLEMDREERLSILKKETTAQIKKAEMDREERLSILKKETAAQIKKEEGDREELLTKLKNETAAKIKKVEEDREERLSTLELKEELQVRQMLETRDIRLSKLKKTINKKVISYRTDKEAKAQVKMREIDLMNEDASKLVALVTMSCGKMIEDFQRKYGLSPRGDSKSPEATLLQSPNQSDTDTDTSRPTIIIPPLGKKKTSASPSLPFRKMTKLVSASSTTPDPSTEQKQTATADKKDIQVQEDKETLQTPEGNPPNQSPPVKTRRRRLSKNEKAIEDNQPMKRRRGRSAKTESAEHADATPK